MTAAARALPAWTAARERPAEIAVFSLGRLCLLGFLAAQFLSLTRLFFVQHLGGIAAAVASQAGLLSVGLLLPAVVGYGLRDGSLLGRLTEPARLWVGAVTALAVALFAYGWVHRGYEITAALHDLAPYLTIAGCVVLGSMPRALARRGPPPAGPLRDRAGRERARHDRDDAGRHRGAGGRPGRHRDRRLSHPGRARLLAAAVPDRAAARPGGAAPRLRGRVVRAGPAGALPEAQPDLPDRPLPRGVLRRAPAPAATPRPGRRAARTPHLRRDRGGRDRDRAVRRALALPGPGAGPVGPHQRTALQRRGRGHADVGERALLRGADVLRDARAGGLGDRPRVRRVLRPGRPGMGRVARRRRRIRPAPAPRRRADALLQGRPRPGPHLLRRAGAGAPARPRARSRSPLPPPRSSSCCSTPCSCCRRAGS